MMMGYDPFRLGVFYHNNKRKVQWDTFGLSNRSQNFEVATKKYSLDFHLNNDLIADIRTARTRLTDWERAFKATERFAQQFTIAINNDGHLHRLDRRVEHAIYQIGRLEDVQNFAADARESLTALASAYDDVADAIEANMSGQTVTAYVNALRRGVKYFEAIAQTIETDFWNGEVARAVTRAENSESNNSSSLGASGSELGGQLRDDLIGLGLDNAENISLWGGYVWGLNVNDASGMALMNAATDIGSAARTTSGVLAAISWKSDFNDFKDDGFGSVESGALATSRAGFSWSGAMAGAATLSWFPGGKFVGGVIGGVAGQGFFDSMLNSGPIEISPYRGLPQGIPFQENLVTPEEKRWIQFRNPSRLNLRGD